MDGLQGIAQMHRFYDLSIDMLGIAGFDGYFKEISASWERILGRARQEILSMPFIDLVHPADRASTLACITEIADGKEAIFFENRYQRKDGSYRWLEWSAKPYPADGLMYCVARDVTERKELERTRKEYEGKMRSLLGSMAPRPPQELEVQAELLRLVQDNLPLCMWAVDQRGTFTHHAGKALSAIGMRQGEHLGKNSFELYPHPSSSDPMRRALTGEFVRSSSEDHGLFWENWFIPIRDPKGEVTAVAGLSFDVSTARRAEMDLRSKIEMIQLQQRTISDLAVPVIEVWDRVLALPMVGVLDTTRAAEMMNDLLMRITQTRARFAVLDLTGVDTLDTATASHLIRLIQAIRLLGAEGIITGIQPAVAQTIIALGVDLNTVTTLARLRDGLQHCMRSMGSAAAA
jgi:rsbT co-antagonist protein RsbR